MEEGEKRPKLERKPSFSSKDKTNTSDILKLPLAKPRAHSLENKDFKPSEEK